MTPDLSLRESDAEVLGVESADHSVGRHNSTGEGERAESFSR